MNGRVVSVKMKNTATVLVTRTAVHALYKKTYVQSKKYLTVDELGVKLGDLVEIVKIKPVSKKKHWKIAKVVGRSLEELVSEQLQEKAAKEIAEVMPEESKTEELSDISSQTEKEETEKQEKPKKRKVKSDS